MPTVTQAFSMSEEEYLEAELKRDTKHEYIDGYCYAMTGASKNHGQIAANVQAYFHSALRAQNRPCRTFVSDTKVKVGSQFFYPDVMVVCDDNSDSEYYTESPVLIVEVLSDSTRRTDRTIKKVSYLNIPSLKEYILIEQDKCEIEIFRKNDHWEPTYYYPGDQITLISIDLTLSVEDIYYLVDF